MADDYLIYLAETCNASKQLKPIIATPDGRVLPDLSYGVYAGSNRLNGKAKPGERITLAPLSIDTASVFKVQDFILREVRKMPKTQYEMLLAIHSRVRDSYEKSVAPLKNEIAGLDKERKRMQELIDIINQKITNKTKAIDFPPQIDALILDALETKQQQ
jgi:hypothetical protein